MKTLKCKRLNGENRCYVLTGDHILSVTADIPTSEGKLKEENFLITDIGGNDYAEIHYHAIRFLEYAYCGYVYNIRKSNLIK